MNKRVALLGSCALSLLLTGCPLTDHYQLMSDETGGLTASAGAAGSNTAGSNAAGSDFGGAGAARAENGGASAGMDPVTMAGEAGEVANSGGPSGGSVDVAGGAGALAAGADTTGGGAFDMGGGGSGTSGAANASGTSGSAGGTGCALQCTASETCCGTGCADLSSDALNCGSCGSACNVGRLCEVNACKGGWVSMAAPPAPFVARSRAAVVAIDKSVFFWGGQDGNGVALDTGAIYNPIKNTWKYLPKDTGTPLARLMASAVWTGSVVIVFGGTDASGNAFRDGASYDPVTSQWTALPANNAVTRRSAPSSYWDGMRAVFWGGLNSSNSSAIAVSGADRFDSPTWSISTPTGDPGALEYPGVAFDGATMYVFGGLLNSNSRQDKVYSYTSTSDTWARLPNSGLTPRSGVFSVWDGTRLVTWGGRDDNGLRSDGSYLFGGRWTPLASVGAPSARLLYLRRAGWGFQISPGVVGFVGGQVSLSSSSALTTTGAFYNVASATWTSIPSWPSNEAHDYGMGAWTGQEFILWGGRDSSGVATTTGERWAP